MTLSGDIREKFVLQTELFYKNECFQLLCDLGYFVLKLFNVIAAYVSYFVSSCVDSNIHFDLPTNESTNISKRESKTSMTFIGWNSTGQLSCNSSMPKVSRKGSFTCGEIPYEQWQHNSCLGNVYFENLSMLTLCICGLLRNIAPGVLFRSSQDISKFLSKIFTLHSSIQVLLTPFNQHLAHAISGG